MKDFSFFVAAKAVKKQTSDIHQAKALIREGLERLELAKSIIISQKPKYALENAYEAVRECIDAILISEGYKSYSHEASISYLSNLGFSVSEIAAIDRMRKQRNGIKYYGENATKEEALEAIETAKLTIPKLLQKRSQLQ